MNSLTFEICPSPDSNDHQVRIKIDGQDWLGKDYIGIDPPEFFAQKSLIAGGDLLIGRCVGCDDINAHVTREELGVSWTVREGEYFIFAKQDYDRLIANASVDTAWEDANRTAERLVTGIFRGTSIEGGYKFDWASVRIGNGIVTLSFSREGLQKTFDLGWDGSNPDTALPGAKRFHKERVEPGAAPDGDLAAQSGDVGATEGI